MTAQDAAPGAAPRTPAPKTTLLGHLARIGLLAGVMIVGSVAGALISALAGGATDPLSAAIDGADDASEPVMAVAGVAVAFACFQAALGDGTARRRRLVALRRRQRRMRPFAPLLWVPLILMVIFADGWLLMLALALPCIVVGFCWMAAMVSDEARRAGWASFAFAAGFGVAIGLLAV